MSQSHDQASVIYLHGLSSLEELTLPKLQSYTLLFQAHAFRIPIHQATHFLVLCTDQVILES